MGEDKADIIVIKRKFAIFPRLIKINNRSKLVYMRYYYMLQHLEDTGKWVTYRYVNKHVWDVCNKLRKIVEDTVENLTEER